MHPWCLGCLNILKLIECKSCSALITLYNHRSDNKPDEDNDVLKSLETISIRMADLSLHFRAIAEDEKNTLKLSPFIPYALYQAIAVQKRLENVRATSEQQERAKSMMEILKLLHNRWCIAGGYTSILIIANLNVSCY